MKRITFFCLLLLSVSFWATGTTFTKTVKLNKKIGDTFTITPYIDGISQPTSQSYSLSENSAFSVSSITQETGTDIYGYIYRKIKYQLTALKAGVFTFIVTQYHPGWQQVNPDPTTYIITYIITVTDPNAVVYAKHKFKSVGL